MLSVKEFGGQNKMFNNLTFYTDGGFHWVSINDTNTTIEKIEEKRKIHKNAKK